MKEGLQIAVREARETFLGLVALFRNIFIDITPLPFISLLKSMFSYFMAGIVTPFILLFCYLSSFAVSPKEENVVINVAQKHQESFQDTCWSQ